jgi:hypothetical protein
MSAGVQLCQLAGWFIINAYQLSDSGDTVFNLFFNFAHVLQDAFSNLALLQYPFRCDTIYFHDDQMSSSFQLCDR